MHARWLAALAVALAACGFDSPKEPPPPNADPLLGCSLGCHGDDISNAPPKSFRGATDTTSVAVGAHRAHLNAAPTWHRTIHCYDCHIVPATVDAPGHIDGDGKAEVIFSMIAGPSATWNGTTCETSCHGSAAMGGAQPTPIWTQVDGSQVTCGSCHGRPPPAPHPNDPKCATCHPTMEVTSTTFRNPESHINGSVETADPSATGGCNSCHGSDTSSAPPKDLLGGTAATSRGVGAHAAHLAASNWHRQGACSDCHVVPLTRDAPGHIDGDNTAEVRFTSLNPQGAYAAGNATCTNLYCHSNGRGTSIARSWVTPGALRCGDCHSITGSNMSGAHRTHIADKGIKCSQCHGTVIDVNGNISNANLHINGVHEVKMAMGTFDASTRRCANVGCHDDKSWISSD